MKQRFTYLDLKIISKEISKDFVNCRLQNVYSLESSNRHFLFKFDHGSGESGKKFMIVDPGLRYHQTKFQHQQSPHPTYFVQKVRKFLKNRRLNGIYVTPGSRTVVLRFSDDQMFLVLEFFAGGNIIVLNNEHRIMTLFRVVRDVKQPCEIGSIYPLNFTGNEFQEMPTRENINKCANNPLAKSLNSLVTDPSTSLLDYCLRDHKLDPKQKLTVDELNERSEDILAALRDALTRAHELFQANEFKGYILRDRKKNALEFEPFREYFDLVCSEDNIIEEHIGYNRTVDEYFGAILSDKQVNRVEQLYEIADSRLKAAKQEKETRVQSLVSQKELHEKYGTLLEMYSDIVGKSIDAVNALVQQGTDWGDIAQLLEIERQKHNTIAEAIYSLQLDKQQITLLLDDTQVAVDLDKSAFANARKYFDIRKQVNNKIEKTEQHSKRALKSAETRINADLQSNLKRHEKQGDMDKLHYVRPVLWFEKFFWFFSSLGNLCIAGRDEFQNELLLNKYFTGSDLLLSSDAMKAPVVIIKNPKNEEIPPQTLLQACSYCVACSQNWESRSKAPAWFIVREQLPKNVDGEPLSLKDLYLVKQKVKIQPAPIDMGVSVLWIAKDEIQKKSVEEEEEEHYEEKGDKNGDSDDDEEDFPDVEFNSDNEFPDVEFNSDIESDCGSLKYDADSSVQPSSISSSPAATPAPATPASPTPSPTGAPAGAAEPSPMPSLSPIQTPLPTDSEPQGDNEEDLESNNESVKATDMSKTKLRVRGQKKKLLKYKNQDEEDRKIMMERLGTLKGLENKKAKEESQTKEKEQKRAQKKKHQNRKIDMNFEVEPMIIPEFSVKYKPQTDPVLMFAPWSSVQKYEFKLKITPGSMKRGKATTEILKMILKTGLKPPTDEQKREINAIRPADVQNAIPMSKLALPKSK